MLFQMMKVDKSAESDATAALSKLKQKEQVGLKLIICLRSQKETPRLHFYTNWRSGTCHNPKGDTCHN